MFQVLKWSINRIPVRWLDLPDSHALTSVSSKFSFSFPLPAISPLWFPPSSYLAPLLLALSCLGSPQLHWTDYSALINVVITSVLPCVPSGAVAALWEDQWNVGIRRMTNLSVLGRIQVLSSRKIQSLSLLIPKVRARMHILNKCPQDFVTRG